MKRHELTLWIKIISALVIFALLAGCQSRTRRPPVAHEVQDRWQVVVAQDGLVQIERTISLDAQVGRYLRGTSLLKNPRLFGEIDQQVSSECSNTQDPKGATTLHCTLAYRIVIMPTERQATLTLPDDLLLDLLTHGLGYQPLAARVLREVSITVPGKFQTPSSKQTTRFSAYASQAVKIKQSGSKLELTSTATLQPGDIAAADAERFPPFEFEPIPGTP